MFPILLQYIYIYSYVFLFVFIFTHPLLSQVSHFIFHNSLRRALMTVFRKDSRTWASGFLLPSLFSFLAWLRFGFMHRWLRVDGMNLNSFHLIKWFLPWVICEWKFDCLNELFNIGGLKQNLSSFVGFQKHVVLNFSSP